jgi:hypothetical protein
VISLDFFAFYGEGAKPRIWIILMISVFIGSRYLFFLFPQPQGFEKTGVELIRKSFGVSDFLAPHGAGAKQKIGFVFFKIIEL